MVKGAVLHAVLAVALLGACAPGAEAPAGPAAPTVAGPVTATGGVAELPALLGQPSLTAAQTVSDLGFRTVDFQSSSAVPGRDWSQDHRAGRSWLVCFQTPAAGPRDRSDLVVLGIVPTGEPCPEHDPGWEYSAYDPASLDWAGSEVANAVDALKWQRTLTLLDAGTGSEVKAGTRGDWAVCSLEETPGDGAKPPLTIRAAVTAGAC